MDFRMKTAASVAFVVAALVAGWMAYRQSRPSAPVVTPPMQRTAPADDVSSVPREPLAVGRARIERGEVLLIDVRDADSYIAGHIPGALHIPLSRIAGEIEYLPRDKPILTYCT
jgi:3-mercaptopyruvate sulfurtransferase SseA